MSLRGLYNDNAAKPDNRTYAEKVSDNVLLTETRRRGSLVQQTYFDFMTRTVAILVSTSNDDRTLTFAEMDAEVLKLHRDILIELGGQPQPLPDTLSKPGISRMGPLP